MLNHKELTLMEFDKLNLNKGLTVLDVGCRSLEDSKVFLERGFKWTGTDIVASNGIVNCPMESMPFANNSFDIIFCCHAFEHCEHPIEALKEFKRLVKKDGIIFISTPAYCKEQVIEEDEDHIFVLTDLQMQRLIKYNQLKLIMCNIVLNPDGLLRNSSLITVIKNE